MPALDRSRSIVVSWWYAPKSDIIIIVVISIKIVLIGISSSTQRLHALWVGLESKVIVLVECSVSQTWLMMTSDIYYFKILLQAGAKII